MFNNPCLCIYFVLQLVKVGDIFEECKVVRVDKGSGLLLEVPTIPTPTPTYINVSLLIPLLLCVDILHMNLMPSLLVCEIFR